MAKARLKVDTELNPLSSATRSRLYSGWLSISGRLMFVIRSEFT